MTKTFYARLQLLLDGKSTVPADPKGIFAPAYLRRFTYKLKITPKPGVKILHGTKSFSGDFTNLRSSEHELTTEGTSLDELAEAHAKFVVTWEIYFDGKLNHSVAGKLFDRSRRVSKEWFQFDIRFTKSNTKWNTGGPANVITQAVSSGVGWYWVKRPETFGDLMKRAFIKADQINWDVMKEVNSHLGALSTMTVLKPGQVVIISKTKSSSPKLQQMKTAARKAHEAWIQANADGVIDQTEMLLIDLLMNGHRLLGIDADDIDGVNHTRLANAILLTDAYKPFADSMMGLAAANFDQVSKAQSALAEVARDIPYTTEKGTIKRATRDATHKHTKPFRLLNDSSFARKLIQWDTGIKANRARDYIRAEVQLRSANAHGGIDAAADNLKKVGQLSKILKGAGYVGLAIEAGTSAVNAHAAYSNGDFKGGNIEVGKGVGGIAAGFGAGALVSLLLFGVATGGVGLVVIGVAAAGAGYLGGEAGKWGGEQVAQQFNKLSQP